MHSDRGSQVVTADAGHAGAPTPEHGHDSGSAHLPPPSIWPLVTAGGVSLGGTGLVTVWPVSVIGLILMAAGLFNWIQELRHEPKHH